MLGFAPLSTDSVSSDGIRYINAAATSSASSSVAIAYERKRGVSATANAQAVVTVSCERDRDVTAAISSTAAVSIDYIRKRDVDATVSAQATAVATGRITIIASASCDGLVTSTASCDRIREAESHAVQGASAIVAEGRRRWEDVEAAASIWTDIENGSGIWTDVSNNSTTWSDVA